MTNNIGGITFGIEVECILREPLFNPSDHHLGDGNHLPQLAKVMFNLSDGWSVKHDGSVQRDYEVNHTDIYNLSDSEREKISKETPCEIICPPLSGYAGLSEIKRFLSFLQKYAYTNSSCGGHVHIGLDSLFGGKRPSVPVIAEFVQNLTLIVAALEDGIFSYSGGVKRMNNSDYCASAKTGSLPHLSNEKWNPTETNRYRAINVHAIAAHGTVEFRLFAGTVDPDIWLTNIMVALAIAIAARDNKPIPHFIKGLSEKNMESVFSYAFHGHKPKFVSRINAHDDCKTYKAEKKQSKKSVHFTFVRQLGESNEDYRVRYNQQRQAYEPRWVREENIEEFIARYRTVLTRYNSTHTRSNGNSFRQR